MSLVIADTLSEMDLALNMILIGLVAYHVALGLAFAVYCGWELIFRPARKMWLRLRPVASTQPMIDMRERV